MDGASGGEGLGGQPGQDCRDQAGRQIALKWKNFTEYVVALINSAVFVRCKLKQKHRN